MHSNISTSTKMNLLASPIRHQKQQHGRLIDPYNTTLIDSSNDCSEVSLDDDCVSQDDNNSFDGSISILKKNTSPSLCSTEECTSTGVPESMEDSLAMSEFLYGNSQVNFFQIESDDDFFRLDHITEESTRLSNRTLTRNVRFETDINDSIIVEVYEYECNNDKESCFEMYTNEEEENENRNLLRQHCRTIQKGDNKFLIRRLINSYEVDDLNEDSTIFNDWVSSDMRGLENYFSQELSFHIKGYVEFVITHYNNLKCFDDNDEIDIDDITDMFRSRIIRESQRSRDFAQQLAIADHYEATKQQL